GLPSRGTQSRLLAKPEVCEGFQTLITALTSLHSLLVPLRSAAAGLDACAARAQEALSRLLRWLGETGETSGLEGDTPSSNDV
ncbi:ATP-dependent DNA helicase, partial [Xylella fastidiosa subsp. multiplex]|nr:ATP-dependent DNA helicase [Xylella fastidiosa subsp. multiplex]